MATSVHEPVEQSVAHPGAQTGTAADTAAGSNASRDTFEATLRTAHMTLGWRETVALAIDSFCASKTRFLLTMLGMVIGSASVILVATLGLTGRQYALSMIASIGPNMIEMQGGGANVTGPDGSTTPEYMNRGDMEAVMQQVPGIVASSPMLEFHDSIPLPNGQVKEAMLLGVSPQYKEVRNLRCWPAGSSMTRMKPRTPR
jgi:putative ABC transport system permease protein